MTKEEFETLSIDLFVLLCSFHYSTAIDHRSHLNIYTGKCRVPFLFHVLHHNIPIESALLSFTFMEEEGEATWTYVIARWHIMHKWGSKEPGAFTMILAVRPLFFTSLQLSQRHTPIMLMILVILANERSLPPTSNTENSWLNPNNILKWGKQLGLVVFPHSCSLLWG